MDKISILLVDDHSMVRQGIKQLLELDNEFYVIGEGSNGIEALEGVQKYKPDVLLMDANMPEMSGLEAMEEIRRKDPNQKVILLTIHNEAEYLYKALQLGVSGYIIKDADADDLIKAIKAVYEGEGYVHPSMTSYLVQKANEWKFEDRSIKENEWNLTSREAEVLHLIAEGKINKEIANCLSISEKTVKNHISNIFRKMDVYDRTQAAILALKSGMIKLKDI